MVEADMTINPSNDQSFADLNHQLDVVVNGARKSNKRKMHRHGKNFDPDMATIDSINLFHKMDHQALAVLAGMAVQRLAKMPDYVPVPEQIAALDFTVDIDAILSELQGSADEMETDEGQQTEQEEAAPAPEDDDPTPEGDAE
jgi:hypothetical protein